MGDILETSWAYQEMVQKASAKALKEGLEKGLGKGLARTLVRFVELHFPNLVPLAKKQVKRVKSSEQLQEILDKLFVAHTEDEAKAALLGEQ
jgi:hypothetical protein